MWERFLGGLPGEFRRAINEFQPFVVLGPALSGKTALIQAYTDCQRQQNQFLDSAVEDPSPAYLPRLVGPRARAVGSMLRDTSNAARKALTRLWTSCFKRTPTPIVVVPLPA